MPGGLFFRCLLWSAMTRNLCGFCGLRLCFRLLQFFLGWRRLFVTVIVVVIAGAAANFGSLTIHQGYNRVVGNAPALDTVIIDHIA